MKIKDLFKRKNPESAITEHSSLYQLDDASILKSDLELETPFASYTPREYTFSPEFESLNETVKLICDDIFNDLSDEFIDNSVERILTDILRQELFSLQQERLAHQRQIAILGRRRASLETGYIEALKNLKNDYYGLCQEYKKLVAENVQNKWRNTNYE